MASEKYTNNAKTVLNGAITLGATSLVVTSAVGFPATPQFRLLIDQEIMLVTAVAGTTFTVTRGYEGTTGVAHSDQAPTYGIFTAGAVDQIRSDLSTPDTWANRPAASKAGNIYLPTDGIMISRDNGSTWASWGPIFPVTEPVDANFSWVNQGGASVTTTNGGIFLNAPANASTSFRIRKMAAPAVPYKITALLLPLGYPANFYHTGILFRESSTGKLHTITFVFNNTMRLQVNRWTNETTFSAQDLDVDLNGFAERPRFLRIEDDNTNRNFYVSQDGNNFLKVASVARTTFMTADQVGYAADSENASFAAGTTLVSWKQS